MHGHDEAGKDHPEDALEVSGSHLGAAGKSPLEEVEDAVSSRISAPPRGNRSIKSTVKVRQHLQKALGISPKAGPAHDLAATGSSLAEDADDAAKTVKPPPLSPPDKNLGAAMRSTLNRGQERQARQRNRGALMRAQTREMKDIGDEFMKEGMIEGKAANKSPRKATISERIEVSQGTEQEEDVEEHSETGTAVSSSSPVVTPKGSKRRSEGSALSGSSPTEGTVDEAPNLPVMPAMRRPRRRSTEAETDTSFSRRRSADIETDVLQPSASPRRRSTEAETDAALGSSGKTQPSRSFRRQSAEAETDAPVVSPGMSGRRKSLAAVAAVAHFARQCSPDSVSEDLQGLTVGAHGLLASPGPGLQTSSASSIPLQAAVFSAASSPFGAESPQLGIGRTAGGRRPSAMAQMMQGIRRGSTVRQVDQEQLMNSLGGTRRKSKKVRKSARLSAQFTSDPGRQPDVDALVEEEDEDHADSVHSNEDRFQDEDKLDKQEALGSLPELAQADTQKDAAGAMSSQASVSDAECAEAQAVPKEGQDKDAKSPPLQIKVTDNEPVFSDTDDSGLGDDSHSEVFESRLASRQSDHESRRASRQSDQPRSEVDHTMVASASSKSLGGESAHISLLTEDNISRSASARSLGADSEKSTATNASKVSSKSSKWKVASKKIAARASERKSTTKDINGRQSVKESKESPEAPSKWSRLRKVFAGKKAPEPPSEATSRRGSADGDAVPTRRVGVSVELREEYLKPLDLEEAGERDADAKSEKSEPPQRPKSALKKKTDSSDPAPSKDEAKKPSPISKFKSAVTKMTVVRKLSNFSQSIQQIKARKPPDAKPRKQLRMLALGAPGTKIARRRSDDTKALTPRRSSGGGQDEPRRLSSGASESRMRKLEEKADRSWVDMPYCGSRDDATEKKDVNASRFQEFLRQRQLLSSAKASFKKLQAVGATAGNPLLRLQYAAEAITEGVRKIQMQRHIVNSFWTTLAERQMRLKIATMLQDVLLRKDENGNEPPCGQAEVSYMTQCLGKCEAELTTMKAGEKGAHLMLKALQGQVGQFYQKLRRQKEAAAEMYNTELELRQMAGAMDENPGELWRKVWNANAFVNRVRLSTIDLKDVLFEFGAPKVTMSTLMAGGLRMADVSEDPKTPKTPKRDSTSKSGFDSNEIDEPASPNGRRNRSCAGVPEDEDHEDADAMLKMLPEETVNSLLEELKQTAGDVRAHVKTAKELSKLGVSYTDVPRLVEALCAQAWMHCVEKAIQKLTAGNDRDATSLRTILKEIEDRLQSEFPNSRPQLMKFSGGRRTSTNLLATLREQEALGEDDDDLDTAIVNSETGRTRRGSICPRKTLDVTDRVSTPGPGNRPGERVTERICTPGPMQMQDMDDDNASFYSSSSEGEADDKQAPEQQAQPSETAGGAGTSSSLPPIEITQHAKRQDRKTIRRRHSAPSFFSPKAAAEEPASPRTSSTRRQSLLAFSNSFPGKKTPRAKEVHKAMQAKAEDILAMGEDRLGVGVLPMSRRPSFSIEMPGTPVSNRHRASFSAFGAAPASLPLSDDLRALWQKMQGNSVMSPTGRRGSMSRRPSFDVGRISMNSMDVSRRGSIDVGQGSMAITSSLDMGRRASVDSRQSSMSCLTGLTGRRTSVGFEGSMLNTLSEEIKEEKRPSILNALKAHAQKLKDSLEKGKSSKVDFQKQDQADAGLLSEEEEKEQNEDTAGSAAAEAPDLPRRLDRSKTLGAELTLMQNEDTSLEEADEFRLPPELPQNIRRSSLTASPLMPFLSSRPGSRVGDSQPRTHSRPASRLQPFSRPASRMFVPQRGKALVEISTRLRGEWGHVRAQRQLAAGRTVASWLGHLPKPPMLPEVDSPRTSPRNGKACSGPSLRRPLFLVADSFITPAKSRFQAAQRSRPVSSETSTGFGLSNEFNFSASLAESDSSDALKRALWSPSSAGSAASPSSRPATSGTCGISRCKNEGPGNSVLLFLPVLSSGPTRQLSTPNSGRGSATPRASPRGSVVG